MKAVLFRAPGGSDQLEYADVPDPLLKPGEVLIRVKACALNHLDLWIREGVKAYGTQLPHIGGCDISGIIEQIEPASEPLPDGLKRRDPVIVFPGLSCWRCPMCLAGQDNLCGTYTILGAGRHGGLAELCAVPAQNLIPLRSGIAFEEAAAFPLVTVTSWHMLISRAALQPGETLLVLGASSGIGMAAVQIGRLIGCRVIATVGTDAKKQKTLALGADAVINHATEDFGKKARELTGGRGVDVVFEHIGPATWDKSIRSLAKGGRLVTCGATTGPEVTTDLRYLFSRQLSVLGSVMGTRSEMLRLMEFFHAGKLKAIVDSAFPLQETRRAQEKMAGRDFFGKIVVVP